MLFMVISDLYNHRWKQWRGQLTNTFLFYTMMLPVHLGGGREMMTLEGFLFFFCFFFFCFFRTLIYILRKPKVFWEKCTIFNVVRALICHYILLEKKKEVQLVIWKTHFESISQILKTYESLMCSNFYIKLTLCVKELFFFFFFSETVAKLLIWI